MQTENIPILKIHKLTQAQYDRELAAGNIDENAIYLTPDEDLKSLIDDLDAAFDVHKHAVTHTPAGTIGSKTLTPAGSVSSTFTGSSANTGSPSSTAAVASSTHTHKYIPAGTVSTPTFTGSSVATGSPSGTTSVYSITSVGTAPSLTGSVSNRCLTLTFSAGSIPTRSSVALPSTTHTHSVVAAGSVSQPTFTGTEASTTSITGTTSVAGSSHTHAVTAKGSVSSTFTGTATSHDHTFTGTSATLTTSTPKE